MHTKNAKTQEEKNTFLFPDTLPPFFLIISPINPIRLLKTENKMKA